jgi:hypothetical protein
VILRPVARTRTGGEGLHPYRPHYTTSGGGDGARNENRLAEAVTPGNHYEYMVAPRDRLDLKSDVGIEAALDH